MQVNDKKLIEMTIAALYSGAPLGWRFACSRPQLKTLSEALVATLGFEKALFRDDASLVEVTTALRVKNAYARAFEKEFGQPWPL